MGVPDERRALRSTKLSHQVATAIVEDIVERGLTEGDRLPTEAEMLERFGVGRASIREGLRLLETYGVIVIKAGQGGGPVVGATDARDLGRSLSLYFRLSGATYRDLIAARLIVDPMVARFAAERNDPQAQEELRAVVAKEATGTSEESSLGADFHRAVTAASGNPVLILLARSLRAMYAEHLHSRGIFPPGASADLPSLHEEICTAIIDGDGPLAETLMRKLVSGLAERQEERTAWFMDERVSWNS